MLKPNTSPLGERKVEQPTGEFSDSLSHSAHGLGTHEIAFEQLKVAVDDFIKGQVSFQKAEPTAPPLTDSELSRRSINRSRSSIVQANQRQALQSLELEQTPAIDLNLFQTTQFVIPGYDRITSPKDRTGAGNGAQDYTLVRRDAQSIVAVLADGVSGAPLSRHGASVLSNVAADLVARHLEDRTTSVLDPNFLGEIYADLYKEILNMSEVLGLRPATACHLCFATTLQIVLVTPKETLAFGLGDGHMIVSDGWQDLLDHADRSDAMKRHNIPPLISTAVSGDCDLTEQRSATYAKAAHYSRERRTQQADRLVDNAELMKAFFEESLAFDIYRYQSTATTLATGVAFTSDGLKDTDLKNRGTRWDKAFPHHAITAPDLQEKIGDLMRIWNVAVDDPEQSEVISDARRIKRTHDTVRDNRPGSHELIEQLVERALINSDSTYCEAALQLSPSEALEYCYYDVLQIPFMDRDLTLLSKSLKREAVKILNEHLPELNITETSKLVPLSDDFSLIAIKGTLPA